MTFIVDIDGVENLGKLARALNKAGRKDLKKELYSALNRATKKPRAEVPRRALATLPRRGGLAARVAKAKLSTRRIRSGVRVTDRGTLHLSAIDAGRVRHPVFGNEAVWVLQRVKPGFFSVPMRKSAGPARREIERALARIANQIGG